MFVLEVMINIKQMVVRCGGSLKVSDEVDIDGNVQQQFASLFTVIGFFMFPNDEITLKIKIHLNK